MKKRVAYIGISYPLLYDYRHQAKRCSNDLSDSPNPIIESPLGLMILFDELLFLCRSLCPNNMRNLPYVKFVDELYPDFYFGNILENSRDKRISLITAEMRFNDIVSAMHIESWERLDTHTHGLRLGDVQLSATSNEYNFMFDMYIFEALQQRYDKDIELVANSKFSIGTFSSGTQAELIDKIIISEIPNYNSADGPYHSCMEELRENKFIKDFRQWIVKEHSHLQRSEIRDICVGVERNMNEVQNQIFRKYLDEKSGFTLFKSTSSTLLKTIFGAVVPAASLPISIADAFAGNIKNGKQALDAKSLRWQGFIMDSRKIIQEMQ